MTIPNIPHYPMPTVEELPASRVAWKPDPSRAVLLVHDMQAYFVGYYGDTDGDGPGGPMATVVPHIRALAEGCRAVDVPVVYTAQPRDLDPGSRGLLNDMWGQGLCAHPDQADILTALAPEPRDVVLTKLRYSAFFGTDLATRMAAWNRDQLWVCGVYAHIGCLVTALDAFMRDLKPFLVADAVAGFDRSDHDLALTQVAGTCGVVTHTGALLAAVGVDASSASAGTLAWAGLQADLARMLDADPSTISRDDHLRDLGLDSVRMLELLERLEQQLGPLDVPELLGCETAGELWEALTGGP